MNRRLPHKARGFSLIELLVVLSLLSVVSTIGVTGFFRMSDYWNDLQAYTRLNRVASQVLTSMTSDFENMASPLLSGSGITGQRANIYDNIQGWRLLFEDDSFSFPVRSINPATSAQENSVVTYAIERGDGLPRLVRTAAFPGAADGMGSRVVVAEGVVGMRIHYFNDGEWHEEWDVNQPPQLVRVSVSLMDPVRVYRQVARNATFLIHTR